MSSTYRIIQITLAYSIFILVATFFFPLRSYLLRYTLVPCLVLSILQILIAWAAGDGKNDDSKVDIYGLAHAKLNISVPPATMWMNMGYWETTTDFPTACESLLIEVLKAAGLLAPSAGPGNFVPNPSLGASGLSILDLGFGCGDQSLYLSKFSSISENIKFNYVGITLNQSQHLHALSRLQGLEAWQRGHMKVFREDAAKPETWAPGTTVAVSSLITDDVPKEIVRDDEVVSEKNDGTQNWVLALDTLYHFKPSRLPIFNYAHNGLDASIMSFDLVLSPSISTKNWLLLKLVAVMTGCPMDAFMTEGEYRDTLVIAGYKRENIQLRDITEYVFPPLSRFMEERRGVLDKYGIGMRSLSYSARLFKWWTGGDVVRGVIVVAKR